MSKLKNMCDDEDIHFDKISRVSTHMKPDEDIYTVSEIFKALSDPTRLKIVLALSIEELCGYDLVKLLGITKSGVSHQLRILKNLRIVKYRKEGRHIFYSLDDEHIENLIKQTFIHAKEEKGYKL